jgi:predicted HTH domain antitoxin
MIKIWMMWLVECLNLSINDVSCNVGINQIHKNRVSLVEKYWSEISGIPLNEFRKVSLKKVKAVKVYEDPEKHFGTLCIRVKRSTNLNYQMLGLISGLECCEAKG